MVKNRGFVIPTFDFEPQRGKILSPEFRTYADKLIVEVKGKAFVYACQGLRVHPDERKRLMKSFEAKGWTILDTFTTGSALDTGFIAVRPFSDETYTFEPIGAWRQLPALIFTSSSRKSGIAVKEKKK